MTAIEEAQQTVDSIHGSEGWVAVATDVKSENWEWSGISFYYSPSARRYFWYSDSGCSCNWHMDGINYAADFEDGDRQAAITEAQSWSQEMGDELRAFKEPKQ